ncbi:MAG: hypothetical protein ACTSRP_21435 [Candidatus Helarchaeota archaeon]
MSNRKDIRSLEEELEQEVGWMFFSGKYHEVLAVADKLLAIRYWDRNAMKWKVEAMYWIWINNISKSTIIVRILDLIKEYSRRLPSYDSVRGFFGEIMLKIASEIRKK